MRFRAGREAQQVDGMQASGLSTRLQAWSALLSQQGNAGVVCFQRKRCQMGTTCGAALTKERVEQARVAAGEQATRQQDSKGTQGSKLRRCLTELQRHRWLAARNTAPTAYDSGLTYLTATVTLVHVHNTPHSHEASHVADQGCHDDDHTLNNAIP